jgi:hypothetical protein
MSDKNNEMNDLEASELTVDDINNSEIKGLVDYYIDKVKAEDVEQIKIYLGMVYFVALAVLTITLFI